MPSSNHPTLVDHNTTRQDRKVQDHFLLHDSSYNVLNVSLRDYLIQNDVKMEVTRQRVNWCEVLQHSVSVTVGTTRPQHFSEDSFEGQHG